MYLKSRAKSRLLDLQNILATPSALNSTNGQNESVENYWISAPATGMDEMTTFDKCKFTYTSQDNLKALSSLPEGAMVVLFTPLMLDFGYQEDRVLENELLPDPFKAFRRALEYQPGQPGIHHIPYIPEVGFLNNHAECINGASAIITVVCEPEVDKEESVEDQMDFANDVLDWIAEDETRAMDTFVLAQCGGNQFRDPPDGVFPNILEATGYDDDIAQMMADTVFQLRQRY